MGSVRVDGFFVALSFPDELIRRRRRRTRRRSSSHNPGKRVVGE